MTLREKLLHDGVKNLKEFGYPTVTTENILTDQVYSSLFKHMLLERKEESPLASVHEECDLLLAEITGNESRAT